MNAVGVGRRLTQFAIRRVWQVRGGGSGADWPGQDDERYSIGKKIFDPSCVNESAGPQLVCQIGEDSFVSQLGNGEASSM